MKSLSISDVRELLHHAKTEVAVTNYLDITQQRISEFADLTDDHQWIHTDVERARTQSPYQTTVAHGFLTLSFLSRFLNESVQIRNSSLLVSCGLSSVRFLNPVLSGSRIRAKVRLRACADQGEFVEATWRFTIECEGVRLPCCIADWVVRHYA
jgi:acyl dehydratase